MFETVVNYIKIYKVGALMPEFLPFNEAYPVDNALRIILRDIESYSPVFIPEDFF